jgi:hypothetical protein
MSYKLYAIVIAISLLLLGCYDTSLNGDSTSSVNGEVTDNSLLKAAAPGKPLNDTNLARTPEEKLLMKKANAGTLTLRELLDLSEQTQNPKTASLAKTSVAAVEQYRVAVLSKTACPATQEGTSQSFYDWTLAATFASGTVPFSGAGTNSLDFKICTFNYSNSSRFFRPTSSYSYAVIRRDAGCPNGGVQYNLDFQDRFTVYWNGMGIRVTHFPLELCVYGGQNISGGPTSYTFANPPVIIDYGISSLTTGVAYTVFGDAGPATKKLTGGYIELASNSYVQESSPDYGLFSPYLIHSLESIAVKDASNPNIVRLQFWQRVKN